MATHLRVDVHPAVGVEAVSREVIELRASHASLAKQIFWLQNELLDTRRLISSHIMFDKTSFDVRILRRLIMFTNMTAVEALMSGSSELSRSYPSLCSANAVRQTVIKSQTTQCTLQEFQLLAAEFSRRNSIRCSVFPSDYYLAFPSVEKAKRFQIVFDTYSDFCQALEIDVLQSEAGLYKEKKGLARNVRAVQVLGVDVLSCGSSEGHERRILLGCSIRRRFDISRLPTLYQRSVLWTEGSFEEGFCTKMKIRKLYRNPYCPKRSTFLTFTFSIGIGVCFLFPGRGVASVLDCSRAARRASLA